ncbi:MAG TPA: SDR family NAD(P)-dependent oxidoreductase [Polyangiaceae bacterium]|nr:SDR family NAD(P)-dependent oxidoreductase [Polyangiaceae bacterium]
MKPMNFRGRAVLVTGASSGLGREMARQLATQHGAHLILVARRGDRLEELRRELETDSSIRVHPIVADLSKLEDVDRVIHEVTTRHDLYAAILNAGITHFGAHDKLEWDAFQRMLDLNVTGVVRMATQLLGPLESRAGGLMFVSSLTGIVTVPYQTAYSATKAFLIHYGWGLSHELAGRNLSITTYAPGGVDTEMTIGEQFGPLRRWLMPASLAAREGIEALRKRKPLHIPGITYRWGTALVGMLPRGFTTKIVAAQYRRALEKTGGL